MITFATVGGDTILTEAPTFTAAPGGDVTLQFTVTGDVTSGRLVKAYSPLRVMRDSAGNREFTTTQIGFDPNTSVDLVLQPSFDRSVNLIINDRKTFPKLINSGFIVRGSNYEITNEISYDDTADDFEDQISLFNVNRNSIPTLTFVGVTNSGTLPAGNYFYYFKLTDNEGNATDIVAESSTVFVAKGSGRFTSGGDSTDKAVSFKLNNIESTRFKFVEVLYERFAGQGGAISNAFKLDEKFPINPDGTCDIFHSGQEAETLIDPSQLSLRFTIINRAQSVTQYNNRLFLANVAVESEKFEALAAYAQKCTVRGVSQSLNADGQYYADPQNVYHKLGYWQQEYYAIGMGFVLKTGGITPSFPVTGITNDLWDIYSENDGTLLFDTRNGWYQRNGQYLNSNGIIRTPSKIQLSDVIHLDIGLPGKTSIEHLAIEDLVLGYFITRAERRINDRYTFAQGYQVPVCVQNRSMSAKGGADDVGTCNQEGCVAGANIFGARINVKDGGHPQDYRISSWDPSAGDAFDPDELSIGEYQFFPAPQGYAQAAISNTYGSRGIKQVQAGAWNVFFTDDVRSKKHFAFYANDYLINSSEFEERYGNGINNPQRVKTVANISMADINNTLERIVGRQENIESNKHLVDETIRVFSLANYSRAYLREEISGPQHKGTAEQIVTVRGSINAPSGSPFSGLLSGSTSIYDKPDIDNGTRGSAVMYFTSEYAPYIGITYDELNPMETDRYLLFPEYNDIAGMGNKYGHSCVFAKGVYVQDDGYSLANAGSDQRTPPIVQLRRADAIHAFMINLPGALANAPLSAAYSDINSRVFKVISPRLKFGESFPDIYGGDCYVGSAFVKVFRGASTLGAGEFRFGQTERGDNAGAFTIVNVTPTAGRVHLHMEIFSENNYNPHSREEQTDANSLQKRTFYPLTSEFNDQHALTPHVSYVANLGLSKTLGSSNFTFFNVNLPSRNTVFDGRVYYTAVSIQDNFKNAFREITGLQYKDYNRKYGPINKITDDGQNLIIVQDSAISQLPTNQQVVVENVLIGEFGVLPERQNVITDTMGSRFYDSIVKSASGLYGVDVDRNKIWYFSGGAIKTISDNSIASILFPWTLGLTDEETEVFGITSKDITYLSNNVIATYDEIQNKVRFLLVTSDFDRPFVNDLSQTYLGLTYNERLQIWESKISYNPLKWFNLRGISMSIPADIVQSSDSLSLWQHWRKNFRKSPDNEVFIKLPYANFYGKQNKVMFEFVVTDDTQFQKILDNLKVIGNKAIPTRIIYTISQDDYSFPALQGSSDTLYLRTTDLPSTELNIPQFNEGIQITEDIIERNNSGVTSNIIVSNYDYIEDHAYVNVGKSMLDDTYFSGRIRGVRDKAIKVRFEYEKPDYMYIQAIIALFRTSVS